MPSAIGYRLGCSSVHGIGVFAARALNPATCLGKVLYEPIGPLAMFASLPHTGRVAEIDGELQVLAARGGFPLWYLNYGPATVRLDSTGRVWTTTALGEGAELLMAPPPGWAPA